MIETFMLTFIYYKIIETIANYSSKKHSDLEKISIKPTHIQQGSSNYTLLFFCPHLK